MVFESAYKRRWAGYHGGSTALTKFRDHCRKPHAALPERAENQYGLRQLCYHCVRRNRFGEQMSCATIEAPVRFPVTATFLSLYRADQNLISTMTTGVASVPFTQ